MRPKFLIYCNFNKRRNPLRKNINAKAPFDALKKWYKLDLDLFRVNPEKCRNIVNGLRKLRRFGKIAL